MTGSQRSRLPPARRGQWRIRCVNSREYTSVDDGTPHPVISCAPLGRLAAVTVSFLTVHLLRNAVVHGKAGPGARAGRAGTEVLALDTPGHETIWRRPWHDSPVE